MNIHITLIKVLLRTECTWYTKTGCARCVRRGTRGVMVIVVGKGYCNTSSNPGRD